MNKNWNCIWGVCCLLISACAGKMDVSQPQASVITESLSATKEDAATKITLSPSRIYGWSGQDKIAVSVSLGGSYSFVESEAYSDSKFAVTHEGTRTGYAVLPSSFAKTYDGSTLTVTYPTSYDISADISAGRYDNANGSAYIPFPMVSVSTLANSDLTFYSIGSLVKIEVTDVPKGTKNLYITFNKVVTGDFTVSDPSTTTPTVSAGSGSSTVRVKLSDSGLVSTIASLKLYIPVPTCSGLSIASSSTTKATVARNHGYAFSVSAIARASTDTDFQVGSTNYIIAPGNLLAYNNSGVIEWSFLSKNDQLITTEGAKSNDPHTNEHTTLPSRDVSGKYQDSFSLDDLYKEFTGAGSVPASAYTIATSYTKTIDGHDWYIPTVDEMTSFINTTGTYKRTGSLAVVGGQQDMYLAKVSVKVSATAYSGYALSGSNVPMVVLFPDGYVDQTDFINTTPSGAKGASYFPISYEVFQQMVSAGAIFLPVAGYYGYPASDSKKEYKWRDLPSYGGYWLNESQSETAGSSLRIAGTTPYVHINNDFLRINYRPVRLVRAVVIP